MNYVLHPGAALEHEEQIVYYNVIQVLAVAPHRKRPGYWVERL